ncbi:hypothetical protein BESB_079790 [Besnoitia besnoiti]|uniref:Transmembrane protein n=1 Tax=Besnoitia besnoiti TaxID=94643 RepID=A0A2A9MDK1_BESBE|nr:hypothetical protein BESB_079790 [Besnoitia besnoiti]PFH33763.1 hypothetical protein BESB_079790 [Besnoitia besnoiti]
MTEILFRLTTLQTPAAPTSRLAKLAYCLLALLNCILFGIGMIVIGIFETDATDILIGILQLILPLVGWIWAVVWGVIMITKAVLTQPE